MADDLYEKAHRIICEVAACNGPNLWLENEGLVEVPHKLRCLRDCLRCLHLRGNPQLRSLPPGATMSFHKLAVVDLSGCGLRRLPDEVATWVNLRELNLDGNDVEVMPRGLGMLRKLKKLDLNRNRVSWFPASAKPLLCRASAVARSDVPGAKFDRISDREILAPPPGAPLAEPAVGVESLTVAGNPLLTPHDAPPSLPNDCGEGAACVCGAGLPASPVVFVEFLPLVGGGGRAAFLSLLCSTACSVEFHSRAQFSKPRSADRVGRSYSAEESRIW